MGEELSRLVSDISLYIVVVPVVVGVWRLGLLNKIQHKLLLFLLISVIIEVLANVVGGQGFGLENLPLLHLYTWLEFFLIGFIFFDHLKQLFSYKLLAWVLTGYTLFIVANAIWLDGLFNFNPHARALESILAIGIVLSYFFSLLREMKIKRLELEPLFWISTAFLIYFSGSLLIFIVSEYVSNSQAVMLTVWGIHGILNIITKLLFAVALWVRPQS